MTKRFAYFHELVLFLFVAIVLGTASTFDPTFVTMKVQAELANSVWELVILALPMTLIVSTGGIDLSVGAAMSLSAVAMGLTFERTGSIPFALLAAIATGSLCGVLNGVLITKARVHPLIVTLATMSVFYGLAEGFSNARPISGFPSSLSASISGQVQLFVSLIAIGVTGLLSARTVAGQALPSIGFNEVASRFSGVAVDRAKIWLYTLSGSAAGTAALFFIARRNTAKADIGQGIELEVITAVVLGGTSITGGKGSLLGTLLGVLLVHEARQFVSWHWEHDEIIPIVIGTMLVVTVLAKKMFDRSPERAK